LSVQTTLEVYIRLIAPYLKQIFDKKHKVVGMLRAPTEK